MKILFSYFCYIVILLMGTMFCRALTHSISDTNGLRSFKNPPRIIPGTKDLIYRKNDRIEIACEANESIFWSYPKFENKHNFGSRVEIDLDKVTNRSNLIVHNATFADTGFYRCYRNSTDESRRNPSSIYVYVYDPNHLLIFWEHNVFNVYELNTTTLSWCKPTSPNIHVAIMLEGKTIMNSTRVSYPFTYDPRYGFTVENIYETIVEGNYVCIATDSSHLDYKKIEVKLTAPPLISIKTEKEFYKPDEPISIECHISTDSFALGRLDWNSDIIKIKQIDSKAVLSYNTIAKQSGKFYCIAQNTHGRRYETLKVFVTDLNKGCDVWHNESNKSIYEGEQMTLECGATKQRYNNKIQWYFNNSLLDTNQRPKDYKIVNYATCYSHRSLLIITDIKYANAGNYECRVEKEPISCGRIDMAVQGKPLLSCSNFDRNKTYGYYEMIHLHCRAMSNPLPWNIECVFKAADRTDNITITSSGFDRQTVMFNLMLFLYASGNIHCKVTNGIGTSEISLDVNIASKYYNNTDIVVRNDSVVIPCRSTFPDVVMNLMHNNKQIASSIKASSPYNYDPNVGFIIQNPYENLNSSECYCLPERTGESYPQHTLLYKISDDTPRVQTLTEFSEYEYNTTMEVKCVILSFSPIDSIHWYFIEYDWTETKLNESLCTTTACSTKKDLCTEAILKMPANESGALRCEVSSGSKKHSIVQYIHVNIKQTGTTYSSNFIIVIVLISINLVILLFFRYFKKIRRKCQKSLDRTEALITNNELRMERFSEISPNESI